MVRTRHIGSVVLFVLLVSILAVPRWTPALAGDRLKPEIRDRLEKVIDPGMRRELELNMRLGNLNAQDLDLQIRGQYDRNRIEKLYSDKPLGVTYNQRKTWFRVFAPRAFSVTLYLCETPTSAIDEAETYELEIDEDGVWEVSISGRVKQGMAYQYIVTGPEGPGECFDPDNFLSDPYAQVNWDHNGRSIVTWNDFKWEDKGFVNPKLKDLVLYEMHVRDYTAHESSGVPEHHRGKYMGLTYGSGSGKVLGHLKDLGVTAVELLPIHEFDNRAAPPGMINHWGYMTSHYFAPESYYASTKNVGKVLEVKKMVNALHRKGIAVILDVVYNHTCEGNEDGPSLNFKGFDNKYYYRLTPSFFYWNASGCGNEYRSDTPMGRKLIVDSLKHWVKEYHIDGFRFDLATILDKDTMYAIANELPKNIHLIAEPWCADWGRNQWNKGDFRDTRWSKWNDDFKKLTRKFVGYGAPRGDMQTMIGGTCYWWAANPQQSTNFVECHDNDTLDDHLGGSIKENRLAAMVLMTSQGLPMLHEGQEFKKNKQGNDNSYNQDTLINHIDWSVKKKNRDLYEFYKGLIQIRMTYPSFRYTAPLGDDKIGWMFPREGSERGLGYHLYPTDKCPHEIIVLLNSDHAQWMTFDLPAGKVWDVICDGEKVDDVGLYTAEGNYRVPPKTGIILRD